MNKREIIMNDLELAQADLHTVIRKATKEFNYFKDNYMGFHKWPELQVIYSYMYTMSYLSAKYADEICSERGEFTASDVDVINEMVKEDTRSLKKEADKYSWITKHLPENLIGGVLTHAKLYGEIDFWDIKDKKHPLH